MKATVFVVYFQISIQYLEVICVYSMYTHNKPNTPTSFIDLIEFFTDKGLHTEYTY